MSRTHCWREICILIGHDMEPVTTMEYHSIEFDDVLAFAEETDLFGQRQTLLQHLRRHCYEEALATCSMVVAEYFQAYRADGMCGRQVNQVPLYRRLVQLELMIMILAMQSEGRVLAAPGVAEESC